MSIKERITEDLKQAMKERERERLDVLRMLRARILEREVELRSREGRDYSLSDEEAMQVISAYAKQRRQSIESYREAGRDDLADKEERELKLVEVYLPEQLSDEEIESIVEEAVSKTGASSPADLGSVMKEVMPKVQGRADGKRVSQIVRDRLASGGAG